MKKMNVSPRIEQVRMYTSDTLAWMSDEEIVSLSMNLEKDRDAALNRGRNPKDIEIELCYVQREWDIRSSRKIAHEKWVLAHGGEVFGAGTN